MSQSRALFAALILIVAITGIAEADGRMIVPVVGSTAGVNGANFRTEMQLHNPGTGVMRGSLMFLPQSAAPEAAELATLDYEIGPKQTIRYADVLATMGATGLGSLDILPFEGGRPRVVVRAFDDQGNFGTRGLMIPVLEESDAPVIGYRFVLVAPANMARYRFNIGVRTLGEDNTTFRVVERDAAGTSVGEPIMLEYAGETFRQQPAQMLLGREPVAGHTYSFEAQSGSAFVYATTVDNQTNDGALQLDRPVNRPPLVADATVTTDKNNPVTIDISATDPDDDPMTWAIVSGPSHGTLSDITVGTKTVPMVEASLVYTPSTDYQGPDMFTLLVSDDVNGRTFAEIVINVGTQTGDAPTAVNDRYTMDEGTTLTVSAPGVLANDTDPEGNALVAQLVQGPVGAVTFSLNADGSFTYRPRVGYFGADFFQYTASDGGSVSNVARVSIIVNSTNLPPVAVADFAATTEDVAIGIAVLANDSDPDDVTLTIQSVNTAGTLGAVTIGAGGIINYNPTGSAVLQALAAGATLDDTFTYTISDSRGETATATVTVTVTGVDDVPLAVADSATLLEDAAATAIAVLANDTDIDGGPLTIASVTQGTIGAVVITGGGTGLTYQPNADACGSDSFTYTLNGGSTATVTITVTCVNDVPVFAGGGDATVLEDSGVFSASPWATGVSAGPANESGQTLTFTVTNDN
ncbi:MAG: Ig-like domain-containing protein, partial [Thermoanaerobaculia bacterium]